MSAEKEKLIETITAMTENEIKEVEPTDEEAAILDAFENGDPKYAPDISIEDLKKELGLESAFGIAHKYANPDLMSLEKEAFANAMAEKHATQF